MEVFCHQKVLESCFKEIFNNISKTIEPLKKVLFKIKIENNICIIEVKNNGKKNKNNREGTGISTYNGILNSYDNGSLTFDKINNEEIFKFKTVIELKEV